jgi:hypothetical protein
MRRALALFLFAFSLPALADITVSTVTPAAGLISGGTVVHLHGTNLLGVPLACAPVQCSVFVQFGDVLGTVIFDSSDEIVVIAPPHAAGPVDLVVNVPINPMLTLKSAFTYQDPHDTTVRVLLPIAMGTPGTFNTQWQADVLAHNETTRSVDIAGTTVPSMSTRRLSFTSSSAVFLDIPRSIYEGITLTTHAHDATHDAESLGVDVPSVPETQFRRAVLLPGIPNDSRYRVLLRVYGYPGTYPVTIRTRDDQTQQLIDSQTVNLSGSGVAYLQLPLAAPASSPVVRIEVTAYAPIWAFITLTNNTTQNVTTITPAIGVAPAVVPPAFLSAGRWATPGTCMTVDDSGVAIVNTGCGVGHFPAPPVIDPDGHFEADGTFITGPIPFGPQPAHYSGVVDNGTLVLTIRTGTTTIGPLTLQLGSTVPCPFLCP